MVKGKYVIMHIDDLPGKLSQGRPKVHAVKLDSNFWRQKKNMEKKYGENIRISSTNYRVDLAAHIEPCKRLNHFLKKFNFQLQYSIL